MPEKYPAFGPRQTELSYSAGASAIVFLVVVVVGSAYIIAAKLSGVSPWRLRKFAFAPRAISRFATSTFPSATASTSARFSR